MLSIVIRTLRLQFPVDNVLRLNQSHCVRCWCEIRRKAAQCGRQSSLLARSGSERNAFTFQTISSERAIFPESAPLNRLCLSGQRATTATTRTSRCSLRVGDYAQESCCVADANADTKNASQDSLSRRLEYVPHSQRITEGVAAHSPGTASSYLNAKKGEAWRE